MTVAFLILVCLPTPAYAQNIGPLVFRVAVPAVLLGTFISVLVKYGLLSRPRFKENRPRLRGFVLNAFLEFILWSVAFPAVLVVRLGQSWVYEKHFYGTLVVVVLAGYILNHLTFHRTVTGENNARTLGSSWLVFVFTLLYPAFVLFFALVSFWMGSMLSA